MRFTWYQNDPKGQKIFDTTFMQFIHENGIEFKGAPENHLTGIEISDRSDINLILLRFADNINSFTEKHRNDLKVIASEEFKND